MSLITLLRLRGGPKRTARPDEWLPPSAAIQGDVRAIVNAVVPDLTPRQAEDLDAVLEQLGPVEVGSLTTERVREMLEPRPHRPDPGERA